MDIYSFLNENGITFERHDHPAVFTCEEVDALVPELDGMKTKNLFLCDDKGRRHFLVTVRDTKAVDLKSLARALEVKKLRFASAARLEKYLDLTPGAVTLLALVNDDQKQVTAVIDQAVWGAPAVQCHPLVNTSTLVIQKTDLRRF
ncbi:MAG: prolyl-tRNA synthetase associated domain-containing protein, partial [Desulfosarcinaceae bacterium]